MSKSISETILFVGAGQMAKALISGFLGSGLIEASQLGAVDPNLSQQKEMETLGVKQIFNKVSESVKDFDVIFLCVKPQVIAAVLRDLKPWIDTSHLIVSIAAGFTITQIEEIVISRVIRVMPNTPCLVSAGASAYSASSSATDSDISIVRKLMSSVGVVQVVPEKLMGAVTGVSGSAPAYVFMMIEALADGAVMQGLPREAALQLAAQTVFGSAKMVLEAGKHPAQLKDAVTSPGGTTMAAVHVLEKGSFRATIMNAVEAAAKKSAELANL